MSDATPFADFRSLIANAPAADERARAAVVARDANLTKPAGSLGRLEQLVQWLAAWQGREMPAVTHPLMAVFAANHGVTDQGVSAFPAAVTKQMVANFTAGGAAVNQICKVNDIGLRVFELALEIPTPDITLADAFSEEDCAATMAFGMEAVADDCDLLCLGEMGIGNTTVAAALYHGLYGGEAADWVGRGTGVDDAGLGRKCAAVEAAVARVGDPGGAGGPGGPGVDPFELLRRLGGREIAAMTGAIIAARQQRIPVVIDGFVVTAAMALLHAVDPQAVAHCLVAHVSAESAHGRVLQRLDARPLLDLGMRLGEGSGAALAVGIIRAAAATHAGMATFADAGVAGKGE
jgi:nicotinate-nucleotide--dimethylbenzimidazole phosphoribosyltransferase